MKRILIIRPSAIGDIVMASPLVRALRRAYPDGYLAWLAEPYTHDLLRYNPLLDKVILWPKAGWKQLVKEKRFVKLGQEIRHFAAELRCHRFDLAIDGQGLLRSRLLSRLSGAPERVGLDSSEPGKFLMTRIVSRGQNIERISSEYLQLAKVLQLPAADFRLNVAVGREDLMAARNLLEKKGVAKPYVLLSPFTTRPQKHWPDELWAELAAAMAAELGLAVVLLGGRGDTSRAAHIRSMAPVELYDFTGKTSLGQSAALVKLAHAVVGVDTGLTHLAIALDRPTIALFGATSPYLDPATDKAAVLYHRHSCSPCRRRPTCQGEYPCMRSIRVEQVVAAAQRLLQRAAD